MQTTNQALKQVCSLDSFAVWLPKGVKQSWHYLLAKDQILGTAHKKYCNGEKQEAAEDVFKYTA